MTEEYQTQTQTKVDTHVAEDMDATVDNIIDDAELDRLNKEAEQYVDNLSTEKGADLSKVLEQLSDLGEKEQRSAGDSLSALKKPVKAMMDGKNDDIPKTLLELRQVVNQLDPTGLEAKGFKGIVNKILRKNPMEKYIHKYQSIDKQIEEIIRGLLIGRDNLQEDSVGLEMLKEEANQKILELDKQIYLGKQLSKLLDEQRQNPDRIKDRNTINDALEKILIRTKNMQVTKGILYQSIASIDVIKKNNEKLLEAIRNAITLTRNVVTVSATIQLALNNQKKVIDAVNGTNSAIESMMLSNSRALKQNTEETTKMLENPAISLDKLRESFNNIFDAIKTTEESQERVINSSKIFIEELDDFNDEMKKKLNRGNTGK